MTLEMEFPEQVLVNLLKRAMIPIRLFSTKIDTWGSPITMRAYDKQDAEGLARIIFKIPTDIKITAIQETEEEFHPDEKPSV